jgi:phytol kinase
MPLGMRKSLPVRELRRKLFHVILGTAFIMVLSAFSDLMYSALALFIIGFALSVFHSRRPIPLVGSILVHFDREGDQLPGMGMITFFLGVLLVWIIFPLEIAIIGVAVMTYGDPMASVVGMTIGSHPCPYNKKKTFEGTAAFIIASSLALLPIAGAPIAIAGSLGGAIVESLRHPKGSLMNDNVTIPLGASAAAFVVIAIFSL